MSGIFISYRREDCAAYAGRLYDWISQRLGKENIFIDVDTIQPGDDFVEAIEQKVGGCDALLALIGKDWLNSRDEQGNRRLDNLGDFVRVEIVAALNRNIRVIPVLVEGARMPAERDLPGPLTKLVRRQALELSFTRFHQDANRLIETLEKALAAADERRRAEQERQAPEKGESPTPAAIPRESTNGTLQFPARRRKILLAVSGIAVAAIIGGVALWYASMPAERTASQLDRSAPASPRQSSPPALRPPTPRITIDFSASSPIQRGDSSVLRWNVSNAEHVSIDQGIGRVDRTGSRRLSPSETTMYKLTASGGGQESESTVRIVVNARPPRSPTSGTLVWKGNLQAFSVLIIDAASVTKGTVRGALPGLPVRISVPSEMKVMEAPSQRNGWQRLVLQNNARRRDEVKIAWLLILP